MGSYYEQTDKLFQVKTGCDLWGLRQTPGKFLIKVLVFFGRVNNAISVRRLQNLMLRDEVA